MEGDGLFNPIVLKELSPVESWAWQDFEKAHLLYLAATVAAHVKVKGQFPHTSLTLGMFLREAQPSDAGILSLALCLPTTFNALMYTADTSQCIPKSNANRAKRHSFNEQDISSVHLTADGTPIVDGYLNLILGQGEGRETNTLYVQYKHSGLPSQTSPVSVSKMNEETTKLRDRLKKHGCSNQKWILLWVTNRQVIRNEAPDPYLIWVDKTTLEEHAPLLGSRGLVPQELLRCEDDV